MNLPNSLTIFRILLTPVFVYYFTQDNNTDLIISIGIFIIASFTDWFDGYYARKTNSVTRFGQFMDPLADKVLNLSATFLFASRGFLHVWILYVIIFRDIYTTALRMYALMRNQPVVTSRIAQWKTFLHMALIGLVFFHIFLENIFGVPFLSLDASYSSVLGIAWLSTAILSVYTSIDYTIHNWNQLVQLWRFVLKFFKFI
jgi:CDP-diacylglycerol--glycerol-3-phosphate 3-phosphatidyltransferase